MHLLILTPQLPYPPHQGTTIRNYNLIEGLAPRHTIDLFSLLSAGDDPEAPPLRSLVQHLVTAPQPQRSTGQRLRDLLRAPQPDMALRLWNAAAFEVLRAHIQAHPPHAIQVEGIEMAPYLLALQDAGVQLPFVMYDAHNAEALLQRRAFLADLRRPRLHSASTVERPRGLPTLPVHNIALAGVIVPTPVPGSAFPPSAPTPPTPS